MAEPWMGIVVVIGLAVAVGAVFRGMGRMRRRRGTARIPPALRVRQARGVRVRVEVEAGSVFPGMNAARRNITTGDLALSADRFVLSTERGVLVDVSEMGGRRLGAARCTGPGRLVLEGDRPRLDGSRGSFRIELALDDAESWAEALQTCVS